MREPSPRASRLAITGGLAALILAGGTGFLIGRETAPQPAIVSRPEPAPPAPKPVILRDETLGRADFIAIAATAADAAASGTALPAELAADIGKRFELTLPFGCDGPAPETSEAAMRWRYDADAGALRVQAAPIVWAATEWAPDPSAQVEAMEGFWLERPWSLRERCPATSAVAAAPGAEAVTLPGQTLGVVQIITPDTPRQMFRDGKPYEAVVRMAPDAAARIEGLSLRLSGRIGRFPDGHPVACRQPGGREQRPVCLVAVNLEELAIQNPNGGEVLASWQPTAGAGAGDRRE